ncbi:MAG TPA: hypothetical protein VIT38_02135 [Allosphingosinicella sp.]
MAGRYVAVKPPRFEIEQGMGGERVRIRARRNVFALLFFPFWLSIWTIGGVAAVGEFLRTGEPFLAIWLCGWAAGEIFVGGALAWMIWGSELIGVTGGDLEIGQRLFGWTRSRLYRGRDVGHLSAAESNPFGRYQFSIPFLMRSWTGAIKFSYGGRTVYAAQGLDEAEGRMIVERLLRHLPQGAAS